MYGQGAEPAGYPDRSCGRHARRTRPSSAPRSDADGPRIQFFASAAPRIAPRFDPIELAPYTRMRVENRPDHSYRVTSMRRTASPGYRRALGANVAANAVTRPATCSHGLVDPTRLDAETTRGHSGRWSRFFASSTCASLRESASIGYSRPQAPRSGRQPAAESVSADHVSGLIERADAAPRTEQRAAQLAQILARATPCNAKRPVITRHEAYSGTGTRTPISRTRTGRHCQLDYPGQCLSR